MILKTCTLAKMGLPRVAARLGWLLLAPLAAAPAMAQSLPAQPLAPQPSPAASREPPTAPPPLGASLDPAQARQLLAVLQDNGRRQALVDQLRLLAADTATRNAAPAGTSPPTHPTTPAARTITPATPKALVPGSLGEELVGATGTWVDTLSTEIAATTRAVTGFPAMVRWVRRAAVDPGVRAALVDAGAKSALILGAALIAFFALRRLLRRFMQAMNRAGSRENGRPGSLEAEPDETVLSESHPRVRAARSIRLLRRLPLSILRAVLAFLPALAFAAVGELMLGTGLVELFTTKMIVIQSLTAFVWFWACGLRRSAVVHGQGRPMAPGRSRR